MKIKKQVLDQLREKLRRNPKQNFFQWLTKSKGFFIVFDKTWYKNDFKFWIESQIKENTHIILEDMNKILDGLIISMN